MSLKNYASAAVYNLIDRIRPQEQIELYDNVFAPPQPMPHVAPDEIRIAMDNHLTEAGVYRQCNDYIVHSVYSDRFLGYHELAAWEENWLLRAMVEPIVKAICKKWIVLKSRAGSTDEYNNEDTIQDLYDQLKAFKIHDLFKWAAARCCYAGGCKLFIDTGERGEDLKAPLIRDGIKLQGKIKGFIKIEPQATYPGLYNTYDPLADDFFSPEHWFINNKLIHRSRFIHFTSNQPPYIFLPKYNFNGIPIAQIAKDVIKDFMEANAEVTHILKRLNLDVFKTDLSTLIKTECRDGTELEGLHNRIALFAAYRDNSTALVMDKETEDFQSVSLPLSGLDTIVAQKLELLALVPRLPVIKIFGTPPKGFNATGEADENTFAERIAEEQSEILSPGVKDMLDLLMLNSKGEIDEDVEFEWPSIKEQSDREKAEVDQIKANTSAIYVGIGAVQNTEIRQELVNDPNNNFKFIEDDPEIERNPVDPHNRYDLTAIEELNNGN